MSTRMGMADGRCATINASNRLLNEGLMTKTFKLKPFDSYEYRMMLQNSDPDKIIPGSVCALTSYKDVDQKTE